MQREELRRPWKEGSGEHWTTEAAVMEEESFHRPRGRCSSPAACPLHSSPAPVQPGAYSSLIPYPTPPGQGKLSPAAILQVRQARGALVRESIPRQVDEKSGVPEEERGVWGSQGGGKDKLFFPLHSLV